MKNQDIAHLQKRFQDLCVILCKMGEMLRDFTENTGKYKNIQLRINRLSSSLFCDIVARKIPYSAANNCYRTMKNLGFFPPATLNANISNTIIYFITKTCPLFILQYSYYKVYFFAHWYSKIILFLHRQKNKI
jgi:hypothetical protein